MDIRERDRIEDEIDADRIRAAEEDEIDLGEWGEELGHSMAYGGPHLPLIIHREVTHD